MKRYYRFFTGLFVCLAMTATFQAYALEKKKEYHESWPAGSIHALEINNRFGEIKIADNGGGNVTVDVVITVEAPNEKLADELLQQISVSLGKSGSSITAETQISKGFKSSRKFSIDYEVNIPPDKNLRIANKYGNTFVNILNANGMFDIQHGNFKANELNTPENGSMEINLAYGKSDIESAKNLKIDAQYSTLNLGGAGFLTLNSKYNVINIPRLESIQAESKYDTFNFGSVSNFSANTKYTRVKVSEILKSIKLDTGYGGINFDRVDGGFESVSITSSYGQISLGMGSANYSIDASCDYCGISYPETRFSGDRISENQSRRVKGKVGSAAGGNVYLRSRYGQIKLD